MLENFRQEIGDRRPLTLWGRIIIGLRTSKIMLISVIVDMLMGVADAMLAETMNGAQFGVRLFMGCWTCSVATYIFIYRGGMLGNVFERMADVVRSLEKLGDIETQDRFRQCAKWSLRAVRFYTFLSIMSMIGLGERLTRRPLNWQKALSRLCHTLIYGHSSNMQLHPRDPITSGFYYAGGAFQVFALPPTIAGYNLFTYLVIIHFCLAEVNGGIARALQITNSMPHCARLQRGALSAGMSADHTMTDLMPLFSVGMIGLPLFCSVELVSKGVNADFFAMVSSPLILTTFAVLCEVGDRHKASRSEVGTQAFFGPWLEEGRRSRSARIGIMQASGGTGGLLGGYGMGKLDRPACSTVVKTWFSYVQIILQVQQEEAV